MTVARRLLLSSSRRLSTASKPASAAATWSLLLSESKKALETSGPTSLGFGLLPLIERHVLNHGSLAEGLSATLGAKLNAGEAAGADGEPLIDYQRLIGDAYTAKPEMADAAAADLERALVLDPAADGYLKIYLFFKGFHCVQCARVSNYYWHLPGGSGRWLASAIQSEMSNVFGVDIHPAAQWGRGITMDHGTGCVIGETAVIGDNVYIMHDVTLGATGTSTDHNRHPKIGKGVFLAAKCTVLGNIVVGENAVVGAHALVNKAVPPGYMAVGVPAKILPGSKKPKVSPSGALFPEHLTSSAPFMGGL